MDARKERIGEHAAEHAAGWAVQALGPVPERPAGPAGVGAPGVRHRRLPGAVQLRPPDGADRPRADRRQPGETSRLARRVRVACGPVDGWTSAACPTGHCCTCAARYETETAWAPRHVGRELRQVRAERGDASLAAIRSQAEERGRPASGGSTTARARHAVLARSYQAMETAYRSQEAELEQTMEARREWERATEAAAAKRWPPTRS